MSTPIEHFSIYWQQRILKSVIAYAIMSSDERTYRLICTQSENPGAAFSGVFFRLIVIIITDLSFPVACPKTLVARDGQTCIPHVLYMVEKMRRGALCLLPIIGKIMKLLIHPVEKSVVGRKELIYQLVEELKIMQTNIREVTEQFKQAEVTLSAEGLQDMRNDCLDMLKAILWMLDGARYLWEDKEKSPDSGNC